MILLVGAQMYANTLFHYRYSNFTIKDHLFLLPLLIPFILSFIFNRYFPRSFCCSKMSSTGILWRAVFLLLVDCATILFWFFLDNVKKRRRPHKKQIFICGDCWLLVFDFLAPSQLGLGIALISRRFDLRVDEHFKTRKWKLEKQFIIQWDINGNGTKQMQIVKSDGNPLPIPHNPLPNKVIGFKHIQIFYIDQNVVAFLRRFRRIFANCAIDLYINTRNGRILEFVLLNIWPILRDGIHVIGLNSIAFRRLRQLAPSLLNDSPSLRYVSCDNVIFPTFPPDDSAMASDGQAVTKWLFTPRLDGIPKWLSCCVNSPDQWSSTVEQLKTAFSDASSPVTFRIYLILSSTLIGSVVPFDWINEVTGEKLTLKQYGTNEFWLSRCPIVWDQMKWTNTTILFFNKDPLNHIHFLIRDGAFDDGLLDAASPGPSDQQQQQQK